MGGPAQAGAMIYANDIKILTKFYIRVCGLSLVHQTPELNVLAADGYQLVIQKAPFEASFTSPPEERPAAIKLFFTTANIEHARMAINESGGRVKPDLWRGPVFSVCNVVDPEGNVFHLRWHEDQD